MRNAAKCLGCGTVIESKHRHDFVVHECTQTVPGPGGPVQRTYSFFVDGGKDYMRRGFGGPNMSMQPEDHFVEVGE